MDTIGYVMIGLVAIPAAVIILVLLSDVIYVVMSIFRSMGASS